MNQKFTLVMLIEIWEKMSTVFQLILIDLKVILNYKLLAFAESKKSLVLVFLHLLLTPGFSGIPEHESQVQAFVARFTISSSSSM